jgi:transcriptional regulator with XRE-family HTH domain
MNGIKLRKNITALRIMRNLTQNDVARDLKISRSRYSNWENSTNLPSCGYLIKLAVYYKVSLDTLVFGDIKVKRKI